MKPEQDPVMTAQAGDVLLVARTINPPLISRVIQQGIRSWYSHAMIALGNGRYAHARAALGRPAVEILGSDQELGDYLETGMIVDLFRPEPEPDSRKLSELVECYHRRAALDRPHRMPFSDLNLFYIGVILLTQRYGLAKDRWGEQLRTRLIAAAGDGDEKMICSEFVHRCLDYSSSRPVTPPPQHVAVVLEGFLTDEPEASRGALEEMIEAIPEVAVNCAEWEELDEIDRALAELEVPVQVVQLADFFTPLDLALSPSLSKIASRFIRRDGSDSYWVAPRELPAFVREGPGMIGLKVLNPMSLLNFLREGAKPGRRS
ncbi:MAG: hypothetical protein ACT4OM_08860 [Actinomycetota bacterium]